MADTPLPTRRRGAGDEGQARWYDRVWSVGHIWEPRLWPEWDLIAPIVAYCPRRLEIGPGTRPRLPFRDTWFVDVSQVALGKLQTRGGGPVLAMADALPFPDGRFDLVAACELLEHIADDRRAVAEMARATRVGGYLLLSVPLQPALWTAFDELVGHFRRYEPAALACLLNENGYDITGFCPQSVDGSQYSLFKRVAAYLLNRAPKLAIWLEDRITLPLGVRWQRSVRHVLPGLPSDTHAPGGTIVCRRISI